MIGKLSLKFFNVLVIFSVLFLYFAKAMNTEQDTYSDRSADSNYALKRRQTSQTSGLIPFPRIGRAYQKAWKSRVLEQIKRREGLIPFPRVGRSGREVPATWLGSRLVKDFQRIYPDLDDQWIVSALKNYKPANDLNEDDFISKSNQNQILDDVPYLDEGKKENLDFLLS